MTDKTKTTKKSLHDADGNDVKIGDKITVLHIRDNIPMADEERPHLLNMLGNHYVIDDIVNNSTQASISITVEEDEGCMWLGLYLFPNEFRLFEKTN